MKVKVENLKGYNVAKFDIIRYTNNINYSKLYRKGS